MVALLATPHLFLRHFCSQLFSFFSRLDEQCKDSMSGSYKRYVDRSPASSSLNGRASRRQQYNGESSSRSTPSKRTISSTPVSYDSPSEVQRPDLLNNGDDEVVDLVVMAIDLQSRGTLGCAYYVGAEEKLCAMEDVSNESQDISEQRWCVSILEVAANDVQ